MGFEHTKASDVNKYTATALRKQMGEDTRIHYNPDNVPLDGIAQVNGIWVRPETKQFIDELSKQFRGATFGVDSECKGCWYNNVYVRQDMWLMLPGEPYALARVGFGNYSPRNSRSENKGEYFMVYSRAITNEKYRAGSDQYHMSMTKDITKAVTNARRFIRRYSPFEMASGTLNAITTNIGKIENRVRDAWSRARNEAVNGEGLSLLYKEIKRLVETDHEFADPKFKDLATAWVDKSKAWAAENVRPIPVYFVQVSTIFRDEQIFEVLEVDNIKLYSGFDSAKFKDANPAPKTYGAHDIPEDIMGKLSVLSLLEPGQYTEGVGVRADETMFWVERT
jgi:hypothetical protein